MTHLEIANSSAMLIVCGIAILICLLQPAFFICMGYKRAKSLGIPTKDIWACIRSSAIFSIIPSLPIIISYLVLVPALGQFFPWLRLSVVGSASYETMVAEMAVTAMGYPTLFGITMDGDAFVTLMMIASISILGGAILVLLFLKKYDLVVKRINTKNSEIIPILTTSMIIGLYATYAAPHFANTGNPAGICALIVAGIISWLCSKYSSKIRLLRDFSFPLSILFGMISASVFSMVI